jgi:predicted DNA-binding mobile mystery protein A
MAMPADGWVRTIRQALGMSTESLAFRMKVSRRSVVSLEAGEADGSVQLNTLRRAADALDCQLFHVLVPRTSLTELVNRAALNAAMNEVCGIGSALGKKEMGVTTSNDTTLSDTTLSDDGRSDRELARSIDWFASHRAKLWQP